MDSIVNDVGYVNPFLFCNIKLNLFFIIYNYMTDIFKKIFFLLGKQLEIDNKPIHNHVRIHAKVIFFSSVSFLF